MKPSIERIHERLEYLPDVGHLLRKYRYREYDIGSRAEYIDGHGYFVVSIDGISIGAHILGWALYHNQWPENIIDHINRIKLDNRISNLRDITIAENNRNRPLQRNNTTGFAGISYDPRRQKFYAKLKLNHKTIHLGTYEDINEAVLARDMAISRAESASI